MKTQSDSLMYVCMYVCMYACMFVYIYIYIYISYYYYLRRFAHTARPSGKVEIMVESWRTNGKMRQELEGSEGLNRPP